MINILFESSGFRILTLFSLSPGSRFNRKEIQQRTKLNNVVLDKALTTLLSSKVLQKEERLYSLNYEDEKTKIILGLARKQYLQLKELPLAVYYLICDFIEVISIFKDIEIFLFGSYAKLIYTEASDIDFAIVYSKKLDQKKINLLAEKLSKTHGKMIETHYFQKSKFYQHKKDPLIKSILRDGVRLI